MKDNLDDLKNKTAADPGAPQDKQAQHLLDEGRAGGANPAQDSGEHFALDDERRVKVLSPGALVAKRFFRNRLAVLGLIMLAAMFLFSFVGGVITPYGQAEVFYTYEMQSHEYVAATENEEFRYAVADGQEMGGGLRAQFLLAQKNGETTFNYRDVDYTVEQEGEDFYSIHSGNTVIGIAFKDIVSSVNADEELPFNLRYAALQAFTAGEGEFTADGVSYTLDENGDILQDGTEVAYISRFVVQSAEPGVVITADFRARLQEALEDDVTDFVYTGEDGEEHNYEITYDASKKMWSVNQETETYVFDRYANPSLAHPLGTDGNGMDMLTRLMYGGRVSLLVGFVVVIIETVIGVILGGIAGYFGKWVDNIIMRVVDVFYCIPSMPLMIIIGAAMDAMQVKNEIRLLALMLVLGFLGWPGIARLVRGQILSLREQEFMTATEACGISVSRRIFRHLVPNVIPQLIVTCTMGLGSVIITEATLSFLGLGVKFPFASWGSIISAVNDAYVMTTYLFVWIPAGLCLLIAVLGFNFVGDGLRDAFDPRMKR